MPANDFRRSRDLSEDEKRRIAKDLERGYKKMAALNLELAEEGLKFSDESE